MTLNSCMVVAALMLITAMTLPNQAQAQSGVEESQQHLRDAARHFAEGDEPGVIKSLETARDLNPASLYTRYNLAAAYARNGKAERALDLLEALARARVDFGISDNADFASLSPYPRFQTLVALIEAGTGPAGPSRIYLELQRIDIVPEGIAWDDAGRRLFFGSMRTGEIFAIEEDRQLSKFAEVRHSTPLAAIGMTVDTKRNLLWVVGTPSFLTETQVPDAPGWSGVFGFDLVTGDEKYRVLRDDVGYGYNDVAVAPNGDLVLTGEKMGRVPAGSNTISALTTSVPVYGSNGVVVTPDGMHVITASYPSGLAVIRLEDGATRFLRAPDDIELYGIDGLYLYNGDLIAVQNGIKPWRVMRFELDEDLTEIVAAVTLNLAYPTITGTTGAIVDNAIHIIGQGSAVGTLPKHVPEALRDYVGRTAIMTVPLD